MDFLPKKLPLIFVFLALAGYSCEETTGPDEDDLHPIALQLVAEVDTLLLLTGHDYNLNVQGIFAESSENIITNSGVLTDANFTYITTDTIFSVINSSQAAWHTSDTDVARVTAGKITGAAPGLAVIWAELDNAVSDSLPVIVSSPQLPPYLIIDPPPTKLIFQNHADVSGWVTAGLNVGLTLNGVSLEYDDKGRFNEGIILDEGSNTFEVIAINPDNSMTTTKTKHYIYYPIAAAGITGHWEGQTLTSPFARPFEFDLYELGGIYIITGTMSIDATMLGGPLYVQDVIIFGLIDENGSIDVSLSRDSEGILVTGFLNGVFLSTGTAEGEFGVTIAIEGWPTATAKAGWTAEREQAATETVSRATSR
jgi:hypothetical protein